MQTTVNINGTHYALQVYENLLVTPPESYAAMDAIGMMADLPAYAFNEGDTHGIYTAEDGTLHHWVICIDGESATHAQIMDAISEVQ
jgi:hypothetical protein